MRDPHKIELPRAIAHMRCPILDLCLARIRAVMSSQRSRATLFVGGFSLHIKLHIRVHGYTLVCSEESKDSIQPLSDQPLRI